jgi:hypothetical protein
MGVQAFRAQLTIERLDEAVIRGLTWPREVQGKRIGISPEIKVARNELAAVVDPYRLGIADLTADAFQRLDNILAAPNGDCKQSPSGQWIGEPCIGRGAEAGMGVDNRENTELVAQCQLVMNKIHRPAARQRMFTCARGKHHWDRRLPGDPRAALPSHAALGACSEVEALTHCKPSSLS